MHDNKVVVLCAHCVLENPMSSLSDTMLNFALPLAEEARRQQCVNMCMLSIATWCHADLTEKVYSTHGKESRRLARDGSGRWQRQA